MLKIVLPSRTLGIAFSHPTQLVQDGISLLYVHVRTTRCKVFEFAENNLPRTVAEGMTICSLKDNFCKATGRRIALTRALEKMRVMVPYLTKAERAKVWEVYLTGKIGG